MLVLLVTCPSWSLPSKLTPVCLVGATDKTTVLTRSTLPLPRLILPNRLPHPFTFGTTSKTLDTEFNPRTRPSRPRKLLSENLFPRTPPVFLPSALRLTPSRVRLKRDLRLFRLRTCFVTWLGRKLLKLLLSPLSILTTPTGPLAIVPTERVVLLWVLLLTPARTALLTLRPLLNAFVAAIVLRFATELRIRRTLRGRILDPTP